jgi:hypothetical protein
MDLPQTMKAGPSTTQAPWSTRATPRTKHARNFVVAISTVVILAFLYLSLEGRSLEAFTSSWSLLFGNSGSGRHLGNLRGDQYLLGVGKADITGYIVLLKYFDDHLLRFLQPSGRNKHDGLRRH